MTKMKMKDLVDKKREEMKEQWWWIPARVLMYSLFFFIIIFLNADAINKGIKEYEKDDGDTDKLRVKIVKEIKKEFKENVTALGEIAEYGKTLFIDERSNK